MLDNYKKEPDKYLYKLVNNSGEVYRTYFHLPNCYDSIENVVKCNRDYLLNLLEPSIKIAVFRKGEIVKPSELEYFNEEKVFSLLQEATSSFQTIDLYNPYMFSKLPYQKIKELSDYIHDFLDCNIVNRDCYVLGNHIQDITLTKEEYIKYL